MKENETKIGQEKSNKKKLKKQKTNPPPPHSRNIDLNTKKNQWLSYQANESLARTGISLTVTPVSCW